MVNGASAGAKPGEGSGGHWLFRGTIFWGSFLLFLLQPMLGHALLPFFGNYAAILGIDLAISQILLLGGFLYAHKIGKCSVRLRSRIHATLLVAGAVELLLFFLLRGTVGRWIALAFPTPWLGVPLVLLFALSLPALSLSAGCVLIQTWASRSHANVYGLYAWSNAGAFVGLLSYPLLIEPFLSLPVQETLLVAGLAVYAYALHRLHCISVAGDGDRVGIVESLPETPGKKIAPCSASTWFLLPALTAFLLNATVAHLFIDAVPTPLVWGGVLSASLLSSVLGFTRFSARHSLAFGLLAALSLVFVAYANRLWGGTGFPANLVAGITALILVGTFLHSWLFRSHPDPEHLTRYYLAIALGGVAGGVSVSFLAPLLFDEVYEYPIALCLCAFALAWGLPKPGGFTLSRLRTGGWSLGVAGLFFLLLHLQSPRSPGRVWYRDRNFYGMTSVVRSVEPVSRQGGMVSANRLLSGLSILGTQIRHPSFQRQPLFAYTPAGGGAGILSHPNWAAKKPMKVAVVGLGVGTLASYGRRGDLYRFFEINPSVVKVACDPRHFSYLSESPATIDLIQGNPRLMLELERESGDPLYDLIYLDAKDGGALPYHLVTLEAFQLFLDRLTDGGILAINAGSREFLPLCKSLAQRLGLIAYGTVGTPLSPLESETLWVYMTRKPLPYITAPSTRAVNWGAVPAIAPFTDNRGSLLPFFGR